ncbi:MAG: hypothetical protein RL514_981 [Verrucomicrobiota bacterium]
MQGFATSIPFWLAIGCLIVGVKRLNAVVYSTAFPCLLLGLIISVISGETLEFGGAYFIIFGTTAFALSSKLETTSSISKGGLRWLAGLIFMLGVVFGLLIG